MYFLIPRVEGEPKPNEGGNFKPRTLSLSKWCPLSDEAWQGVEGLILGPPLHFLPCRGRGEIGIRRYCQLLGKESSYIRFRSRSTNPDAYPSPGTGEGATLWRVRELAFVFYILTALHPPCSRPITLSSWEFTLSHEGKGWPPLLTDH